MKFIVQVLLRVTDHWITGNEARCFRTISLCLKMMVTSNVSDIQALLLLKLKAKSYFERITIELKQNIFIDPITAGSAREPATQCLGFKH